MEQFNVKVNEIFEFDNCYATVEDVIVNQNVNDFGTP